MEHPVRIELWVKIVGGTALAAIMGIGKLIGDPAYHIRVVQSGSHESVFILLGLVIGLTMQKRCDDDSMSALLWSVFMAASGLLVSGLNDLESPYVQYVGFILVTMFTVSLVGTLIYLMRAVGKRARREERTASVLDARPRFVRTLPPRRH